MEIDSEAVFLIKKAADALTDAKVVWADEELDWLFNSLQSIYNY